MQEPRQTVCPGAQTHAPVESQTPPPGLAQPPEVRGVALHTVVDPVGAHTSVPACRQADEPADAQDPPVATHVPPQLEKPGRQPMTQREAMQLEVPLYATVQYTLQPPQLASSVVMSRHAPPQSV